MMGKKKFPAHGQDGLQGVKRNAQDVFTLLQIFL
jgi:hypothetical protein